MTLTSVNKKPTTLVLCLWALLSLLAGTFLSGSLIHSACILFGFIFLSWTNMRRVEKGKVPYNTTVLYIAYSVILAILPMGLPIIVPLLTLYLDRYIYRHIQDENGKLDGAGLLDVLVPMFAILAIEVACNNVVWLYNMFVPPYNAAVIPHLCLLLEVLFFALLWFFVKTFAKGTLSCVVAFGVILAGITLVIGLAVSASVLFVILGIAIVLIACLALILFLPGLIVAAVFNLNKALVKFIGLFAIVCCGMILAALLANVIPTLCGSIFTVLFNTLH